MKGASIDIETTGTTAGLHEVVEIAIILHNDKFEPEERFVSKIRPMRPDMAMDEAMNVNKLSLVDLKQAATPPQVRNAFLQWHMEVVREQKIYPLGHNYAGFDKGFLELFLGQNYKNVFHYHNRDTQNTAIYLRDKRLLAPGGTSLKKLCELMGVEYGNHRAEGDALSTLKLYKKLLEV